MPDNELVFRMSAAALMLFGLVLRGYYQRKFHTVPRSAPLRGRRDKVHYYLVLGSFLLVFVYSGSTLLDFAHLELPLGVRWGGALLGVAALILLVACHRALGSNWSGVLQLSKSHALVTAGPYRYVRHPMYTSLFGTAVAFALLSANGVIALACVASVTFMYRARVVDEESMMLQAFGEAYQQHSRNTGRLLPRFSR